MDSHCCGRTLASALICVSLLAGAQTAYAQNGACCEESLGCIDLLEIQCGNFGGVWTGAGTSCAAGDCDGGACCLPGGGCQDTLRGFCSQQGGTFQAGVSCGSSPCSGGGGIGACCASQTPGAPCVQMSQEDCENNGRIFIGAGIPCDPNPCGGSTPGVCCTGEGCTNTLTQSECESIAGLWLGDLDSCTEITCNVELCCFGEFCEPLVPSVCAAQGGFWLQFGGTCFDDPCGAGGLGACCAGDQPTSACVQQTQPDCELAGRTFMGIGTTCDPNPCGSLSELAACCTGESCTVVNQIDCNGLGGFWLEGVSACDAFTCLNRACCFPEGGCFDALPSQCATFGGIYNSTGNCFPVPPCAEPFGACCATLTPQSPCFETTQAACEADGRFFMGDGVTCASNPCGAACETCPGDVSNDGIINGADVVAFVDCVLAAGGGAPGEGCHCADTNDDGQLTAGDAASFAAELLNSTGPCN